MEAKLKEYRALRRRKELIDNAKAKLEDSKEKLKNFFTPKFLTNMNEGKQEDEVILLENEETPTPSRVLIQPEENENEIETNPSDIPDKTKESWRYFIIKWTVYFIVWVTLYILFLKLEFGAVYFVISVLIAIYLNTNTRPKKKGEVSAYSVFNENCTSIEGTLKAEQFEREIRYGPSSVR